MYKNLNKLNIYIIEMSNLVHHKISVCSNKSNKRENSVIWNFHLDEINAWHNQYVMWESKCFTSSMNHDRNIIVLLHPWLEWRVEIDDASSKPY